jgi:hypothetical protein
MAKIVNSDSGPIPLDPGERSPRPILERKEPTKTPNPKTKAQREGNAKARRLAAAEARQEHAPAKLSKPKLSKWQMKARRKRKREVRYRVVQVDLAAGRITEDEAKKRLPKRQGKRKSDS